MKPPNYRRLEFDYQDLDRAKSIDNCTKCPYCKQKDTNTFICSRYNYKLDIQYIDQNKIPRQSRCSTNYTNITSISFKYKI